VIRTAARVATLDLARQGPDFLVLTAPFVLLRARLASMALAPEKPKTPMGVEACHEIKCFEQGEGTG
jgi:hypothetical protein